MIDLESLNQQIESLAVGESLRLEGVAEDVYHASTGFGSTRAKEFALYPPAKVRWRMDNPDPPKAAYALGNALHCYILEPERFESAFIVQPDPLLPWPAVSP